MLYKKWIRVKYTYKEIIIKCETRRSKLSKPKHEFKCAER